MSKCDDLQALRIITFFQGTLQPFLFKENSNPDLGFFEETVYPPPKQSHGNDYAQPDKIPTARG